MQLRNIKKTLRGLNLGQLRKLEVWIHDLIESVEQNKQPRSQLPSNLAGRHRAINKTYRLEYIRCGKGGCKCADGKLHGPYWYGYWSEDGKTKSQYIGKQLPNGIKSS